MTELVITRGLPASGKTTFARQWVAEHTEDRARVNRDDLRASLFDGEGVLPWSLEQSVSVAQQAQVRALLEAGTSVIVDDTNLRLKFARAWADLAVEVGVEFRVVDMDEPFEICIVRDRARELLGRRFVGEDVIRNFHQRYARPWPEVKATEREEFVPEPYVPDEWERPAYVVDIDGTLAHNDGKRGWYEWAAVGRDAAIDNIVSLVQQLHEHNAIVLMSGRDEVCRTETEIWLRDHHVRYDALHMRAAGDQRDDTVVKAELFDQHVRDKYNVLGVIDDRPKVCRMWRAMGLTTLQVGDPHVEF